MCMLMHAMHHSGHVAHAASVTAPEGESWLAILKRRYALGEITRAQFAEMQHALEVPDADPATVHAHSERKEQ